MLELIEKYWLEAAMGGILAYITFTAKKMFNDTRSAIKNDHEEQSIMRKAVLGILHSILYAELERIIVQGYITEEELENLNYLYNPYIKLHGNGTCEKLYGVATSLPMKVGDKHGDENNQK